MSYWYDKKKKDIKISDNDLHIYIGTEDDLPYPDCGNIYVSVPVEDIEELIKEHKKKLKANKK